MSIRDGRQDLHGLRVLIVEDEYYLANDMAAALRDRGATVVGPAGSLEEATVAIESHAIDRAVLDVNLRGKMSFPVADLLDEAAIPYVIATGYAADTLPERFREKPRLEKPYAASVLAAMLAPQTV